MRYPLLLSLLVAVSLPAQQVALQPDSLVLRVGDTSRVVATLKGAPAGARVTWSGTSSATFTAHLDGRVTARAVGCGYSRANYVGLARGQIKVCVLARETTPVPPVSPPSSATPNRPAGLTTVADWSWPSHVGPQMYYERQNTQARSEVVTVDGQRVLQATYVAGAPGGFGAGRTYFRHIPRTATEAYVAFPQFFQPNYQASDNSNKMYFMMFGDERAFLGFSDRGGARTYNLTMSNFGPNPDNPLPSSAQIVYGRWVTMEWYFKRNTPGARDGVMRVWMDGRLIHDYTGLEYPGAFTEFYFEGTHNGNYLSGYTGRVVPCACWWRVGRTVIAAR